jgi:hypothetical protein
MTARFVYPTADRKEQLLLPKCAYSDKNPSTWSIVKDNFIMTLRLPFWSLFGREHYLELCKTMFYGLMVFNIDTIVLAKCWNEFNKIKPYVFPFARQPWVANGHTIVSCLLIKCCTYFVFCSSTSAVFTAVLIMSSMIP